MTAPVSKCVFCGSPNLTREHVFSKWTHKYMAPRVKGKTESLRGLKYLHIEDNLKVVKMPGALRDWKIKCVCGGTDESCNNGWMRKVEDKARPLLIPLILGQTIRLCPADQVKIATWVALKAMVSEYDEGDYVTTHPVQLKRMKRIQKPPARGWGIWIGSFDRRQWPVEWLSNAFCLTRQAKVGDDSDFQTTEFNSHSSTQVIQKLFIQVVRAAVPDLVERWRFAMPDGGKLFRIWPPNTFSMNWPAQSLTDREADLIATAIHQALRSAEIRRQFTNFKRRPVIAGHTITYLLSKV